MVPSAFELEVSLDSAPGAAPTAGVTRRATRTAPRHGAGRRRSPTDGRARVQHTPRRGPAQAPAHREWSGLEMDRGWNVRPMLESEAGRAGPAAERLTVRGRWGWRRGPWRGPPACSRCPPSRPAPRAPRPVTESAAARSPRRRPALRAAPPCTPSSLGGGVGPCRMGGNRPCLPAGG
jgi:hypothetical protein